MPRGKMAQKLKVLSVENRLAPGKDFLFDDPFITSRVQQEERGQTIGLSWLI